MRILRRRELQALARNALEHLDQGTGAIEVGNEGRTLINDVPADAAPLLVAR